ncbi:MAG TPA: translocation/assembly module TamB domain-containing protein [Gammaproteobacteria bacterium]|nr:translocation/assembly module TamB domain-containing protein [Gammaproteobacteria bacterium]
MIRRILRIVLVVLPALALLLVAGVYAAGSSPAVLAWLAARAPSATGGRVTIGSTRGPLFGPAELRNTTVSLASETVHVRRLRLSWHPASLLRGRLSIAALELDGVRVRVHPAGGGRRAAGRLPQHLALPLTASLQALTIRDIEVERPGGKTFHLDRMRARLVMHRSGRLAVRALSLSRGKDHLAARGDLGLGGDWPVRLALDMRAAPPGLAPVSTDGSLEGHLAGHDPALHLHQEARPPWQARADVTLSDPLGELRWSAHLQAHGLPLAAIRPALPPARVDLDAAAGGDVHRLTGSARLKLEALGPTAPSGRLSAHFAAGPRPMRLQLAWKQVRWVRGGRSILSPSGNLTLSGRPSDYRAELDAHAAVALAAGTLPVHVTASGQGDTRGVRLTSVHAGLLGGHVDGSGRVTFAPGFALRASLAGSGLDPSAAPGLGPEWQGRVAFAARVSGRGSGADRSLRVDLRRLGGSLRGKPIEGGGSAALKGDALTLDGLHVHAGSVRLRAAGHVAGSWALDMHASAGDLADLAPGLAGSGSVTLRVTGTRRKPRLSGTAHLRGLQAGRLQLEQASLRARLGLERSASLDVRLDASGLQLSGRQVRSVTVRASGTTADQVIRVRLAGPAGSVAAGVKGGLEAQAPRWRGRLTRLDLGPSGHPGWKLAAPARLEVSRSAADLAQACLRQAGARACLAAHWSAGGGESLQATLHGLSLEPLQPYLAPDVRVSGTLGGHATIRRTAGGLLFGKGQLDLSGGRMLKERPGTDVQPLVLLDLERARLDFQADREHGAQMRLQAGIKPRGRLEVQAALPKYDGHPAVAGDAPVRARLVVDTNAVDLLSEVEPDLAAVSGHLHADLGIDGTLREPVLSGGATIDRAAMEVPRLGIKLTDVRLHAEARNGNRIAFRAGAKSGGGTLSIGGKLGYVQGRLRAESHIGGSRFQAVDTSQASVLVSPDLDIALEGHHVKVDGQVTVPQARLAPREMTSVVRPSSDQVLVGVPQPRKPARPWTLDARLKLVVGKKVTFAAYGLKGDIRGNLTIEDHPGKPTIGNGELSVENGQYKAYGQELTIDRGRLLFTGGPVANPALDVRATRSISSDLQVGLNVRGTLQQPSVSLWSNQPMTDSDKLAYLLAGHPLPGGPTSTVPAQTAGATPGSQSLGQSALGPVPGQQPASQSESMGNAAAAIGVKGGSLLAQRVGSELGVGNVSLEAVNGSFQQTSLVVGRYLSPRLYISYGYGVFDAVSTFRIRYQLSTKWTLKTQTGANNSADFIYTIER